jgi:hypothetical protein
MREAFSEDLAEYFMSDSGVLNIKDPIVFDPFSGSGTVGAACIKNNLYPFLIDFLEPMYRFQELRFNPDLFQDAIKNLSNKTWRGSNRVTLPEPDITKDAYPLLTKIELEESLGAYLDRERCIIMTCLEDMSYTQKDGQFLRWDSRSPRKSKSTYQKKSPILSMEDAIFKKIDMIKEDLPMIPKPSVSITRIRGSAFNPTSYPPAEVFDLCITSPPYLNRYNYTRTYALELAYLGNTNTGIRLVRQGLFSSTVENLPKTYISFPELESFFSKYELLDVLLTELESRKLPNKYITRMVREYFRDTYYWLSKAYSCLKPNTQDVHSQ